MISPKPTYIFIRNFFISSEKKNCAQSYREERKRQQSAAARQFDSKRLKFLIYLATE